MKVISVLTALVALPPMAVAQVRPSQTMPWTDEAPTARPATPPQQERQKEKPPEGSAEELLQHRERFQKTYERLNRLNPMSEEYRGGQPPFDPEEGVTGPTGPMADLERVLSYPAVQAYLRLFRNPAFTEGANKIIHHPRRMILLYVEGGFFLLFVIFQAWRMSKINHWAKRLWAKLWMWPLYLVIALVVIPTAVLGDAYVDTVRGVVELLSNADLTPPAARGRTGAF